MARLSGKIAAVTGGASGIGEATVRRFVAEGAQVAFADREVERGKRVEAVIEACGVKALFVVAHIVHDDVEATYIQHTLFNLCQIKLLESYWIFRQYK